MDIIRNIKLVYNKAIKIINWIYQMDNNKWYNKEINDITKEINSKVLISLNIIKKMEEKILL